MAGQLTIDTLKAGSGVLATQNGMTGIAKAWVNFVGTTGVVTNSFNVSSVTRNSTGNYTVAFTTAMPDANYAIQATFGVATITTAYAPAVITGSKVAASCVVATYLFDPASYFISILST
jgi:hypothetical protein